MTEFVNTKMMSYLLMMILIIKIFDPLPILVAEQVGRAGWLLILGASLLAIGAAWFIQKQLNERPYDNILHYCERHLGRVPTRLLAIAYLTWFLLSSVVGLRLFQESMRVVIMPHVPISVIQVGILLAALACAYSGFEVMVRLARLLLPLTLVGLLFLLITAAVNNMELFRLFPLVGPGLDVQAKNMLLMPVILAEVHFLFLIQQKIVDPKNTMGMMMRTLFLTTLLLTGTQAMLSVIIPYPSITRTLFPLLELSRLISIGDFFIHVEGIFVFLWFFIEAMFMSVRIYVITYLWQYIWHIQHQRPLMPAVAILMFTGAVIPENILQLMEWARILYGGWGSLVIFGIPLLIATAAMLRSKLKRPGQGGVRGGQVKQARTHSLPGIRPVRGSLLHRLLGPQ